MRKQYALTVGNNYPGTEVELHGCVNDARDWKQLLRREGYEVTMMTEASKGHVVDHLNYLVDRARFGDRIVFTYSGHGTWVPDVDGDEADGRDEALVMSEEVLLLDDELQDIFARLRFGVCALIISDSCHSGTVSRFADLPDAAGERKFISPVELGTPLAFEAVVELEKKPPSKPRRTASLLSGCHDSEYSYDAEFDGRPNGAFTRAAIDSWMHGLSLNHWHELIRNGLPSPDYPQTPQLEASRYRRHTRAL